MKKISASIVVLLMMNQSFAQIQHPTVLPNTQPGTTTLPTPNIRPLQPADLQVPNISFISAEPKPDIKSEFIKVNITVKNAGQTKAIATKMTAMFQDAKAGGGWKQSDNEVDIPAINPGQSYSATTTFKILSSKLGSGKSFNMYVHADATNAITEISETNNESPHILIAL